MAPLESVQTPIAAIRKRIKPAKEVEIRQPSNAGDAVKLLVNGSSRSGRDIKAPLKFWRGEHITYDLKNDVIAKTEASLKSAHKPVLLFV